MSFNSSIFIISGEFSGELHAARLVESLKNVHPLHITAVGSNKLREAGAEIVYDYRDISVMGLSEVVSKILHLKRAFSIVKEHIRKTRPALIILVDFPGFNLRMARYAKSLGISVIYFIPPQIWAWREQRIKTIQSCVDKVISILPFEKQYFESHGVDCVYVGHPFESTVKPALLREEFMKNIRVEGSPTIITIMPGSRHNEIKKHLGPMIKTVSILKKHIPELKVVLPLAENLRRDDIKDLRHLLGNTIVMEGFSRDALAYCDLAIVASGSATLEAAILQAPTIVVYRISAFSFMMAKLLVKVKFISLPNIIAGREVFPEFIQNIDPQRVAEKALDMLHNGRQAIQNDLQEIIQKLGHHTPYESASDAVVELLEKEYEPLSQNT